MMQNVSPGDQKRWLYTVTLFVLFFDSLTRFPAFDYRTFLGSSSDSV